MSKRILKEKIEIDYNDTLAFFNGRGVNKELKNKYNYVLFQDDNPELAQKRDLIEKEKISNLLTWEKGQVVLDLGCGIGRWGEEILKKELTYVGIDYCKQFVTIGKENLKEFTGKFELMQGELQTFKDTLKEQSSYQMFDKIFVNGVFMYLNDGDLKEVLYNIGTVTKGNCDIYIKETAALEDRLTLDQIYSENLTQNYTAIYRSIAEYRKLFQEIFVDEFGFTIEREETLFEEGLRNRAETLDYYFILRKCER